MRNPLDTALAFVQSLTTFAATGTAQSVNTDPQDSTGMVNTLILQDATREETNPWNAR